MKLSLPNYGDFELLFSQIQQFITICSKEQIQFAGDKCKSLSNYSVWVVLFVCFFSNNIFIFVVYSRSPVSFHNALLSGSQAGKILFSSSLLCIRDYPRNIIRLNRWPEQFFIQTRTFSPNELFRTDSLNMVGFQIYIFLLLSRCLA